MFQGHTLPSSIYTRYPTTQPGQYQSLAAISYYGTSCAAWDRVPDTPWKSYCPDTAAFNGAKNWCSSVWCYVPESCTFGERSDVFKGSKTAFFSYEACGVNNCYADTAYTKKNQTGCPNDPTGTSSYKYHKAPVSGANCTCTYEGVALSSAIYNSYPSSSPGKYQNHTAIKYYGHACASWDQMPGTPWYDSCPANAGEMWCAQK